MPPDVTDWVHITAVRDASVDELRFYRNGALEPPGDGDGAENPADDTVGDISNAGGQLYIGANYRPSPANPDPFIFYKGMIDDFRIYNHALTVSEIGTIMYGDPNITSEPNPENGSQNECPEVVLRWKPGENAAATNGHDVYYGTNRNNVKDANTDQHWGVYKGRQDANRYPESSTLNLDLDTVYYWRIDEVNGSDVWKGDVWTFKINDGNAFDPDPEDEATLVPLDANLHWTPGCPAISQDVYFGSDFNDVNDGIGGTFKDSLGAAVTTYDPDPCDFEYFTVYYWRVDSNISGEMSKGHIWSFRTKSKVDDPNLVVWYKFDEGEGDWAYDSSGHEFDIYSSFFDAGNWDVNGGRFEGCLVMDSNLGLDVPQTALTAINKEITVTVWANGKEDQDEDTPIFDAGDASDNFVDETGENWFKMTGLVPTEDQTVGWRAGNDTNDLLEWTEADTEAWEGDWHHFAFVKNENAGTMSIYFDGEEKESKSGTLNSLSNIVGKQFKIGAYNTHSDDYEGKLDDFRVYDYALSSTEIAGLFRGGDLNIAWGPNPYHGQPEVPRDANIAWHPGDYAADHNVFFGTSWEDVNAMTDPCATKGLGDESYDLPILDLDVTYYWRIDEHNDPCTWRGPIWRFTVADYLVVDDMESYDQDTKKIYYTWVDGHTQLIIRTGSVLLLGSRPQYAAHRGDAVMRYGYYTDPSVWPYPDVAYAEAWLPIPAEENDWTREGVKILVLYFQGKSTNDANDTEQMYIGLEDTDGTYAEIRYGDYREGENMKELMVEEWHEWFIALEDFNDSNYAEVSNDVNLEDVNRLYIGFGDRRTPGAGGFGELRIDDIRLKLPTCVSAYGPAADFSGDCIVDIADVDVMAKSWLITDVNLVGQVQKPDDANLLGWWKLDGDATDSSGKGHHGTIEHFRYLWADGYDDVNLAIQITGSPTKIVVADSPQLKPDKLSVCAWVYFSEEQDHSGRVIVKGADNREAYGLEIDSGDSGDDLAFQVRDANNPDDDDYERHEVNSVVWRDDWIHLAGTFDGSTLKCYVNGLLGESKDINEPNFLISQDANGLAIGNLAEADANDKEFIGIIDDVRLYDYAISEAEVVWLASDGTGYVPLASPTNLYDQEPPDQQAVNFRDFAMLLESWLEERKWP
jgi:hypothetical protein